MIHFDVVCPFCSLRCDDLLIDVQTGDSGQIVTATNSACETLHQRFKAISQSSMRSAKVRGLPVAVHQAIEVSKELWTKSNAPLVFGMELAGTRTHRAAIELAERSRSVISGSDSNFSRAVRTAFQQLGMSTCSLGEIHERADLIVLWGADPQKTHPRFLERVIRSNNPQKLIHLTTNGSDQNTSVKNHETILTLDHSALISQVRQCMKGTPRLKSGFPFDETTIELCQRFKSAKSICIVLGDELLEPAGSTCTTGNASGIVVEQLFRLVDELSAITRCVAFPLGSVGVEHVLAWQTGFSSSVNFSRGFPDTSNADPLDLRIRNGEFDCVLIIGNDATESLCPQTLQVLETMHTIFLSPVDRVPDFGATVEIPIAVDGLNLRDSLFRLDGVPLPGRPILGTSHPSVEAILLELSRKP